MYTEGIDEFNDDWSNANHDYGYASRCVSIASSVKKPLNNYATNPVQNSNIKLNKLIVSNGNEITDNIITSENFYTVTEEMQIPHESEWDSEIDIIGDSNQLLESSTNLHNWPKPQISDAQKMIKLDNFNKLADKRKKEYSDK